MEQVFNFYYQKKRLKLSQVDLDKNAIYGWIHYLETLPLGHACQKLLIMLLEVLQLKHSIFFRASLMDDLSATALKIMMKLEHYLHQQEYLKNDVRYTQMVQLFTGLRGLFIQNYFRLHQEAFDIIKTRRVPFWNFSRLGRIKRIFLHTSKVILENFSTLIYQQHSLDVAYLSKQWAILHQVYANCLAMKLEKDLVYTTSMSLLKPYNVSSEIFVQLKYAQRVEKSSSIELLYKQIIVFSIICQRQLNLEDIEQLYSFSKQWAEYVDLHESDKGKYKYKIKLFSDLSPVENTVENSYIQADLYVRFERLTQVIAFKYNYEKNMSSLLNFRIQQVLLQSHERRYQRYRYYSNLDIYLGFYSAYRYLQRNHVEQVHQARYDIIRYHAEVEDKSAKGYKAIWLDDVPKNLRTGEYILLKEQTDVESTLGWQSGVIRRVSKMLDGKVELGIEVLSLAQVLCEISYAETTMSAILAYQHSDGERWLLIFPMGNNVPIAQRVELVVQQKKMQIYVSKALLTTQNFVQSEIRLHQRQDIEVLRAIFNDL